MAESEAPFLAENTDGIGRMVFVCDHASNRIPERWGMLGLSPATLNTHIAWDPGALGVARAMSQRLDAPLIFATVSRLVVDVNRPLASSTLIPATGEGTEIPGNQDVTLADRTVRVASVYQPYHDAVADLVAGVAAARRVRGEAPPAVIAIHTFTPIYRGRTRPWQVGVLFDRDRRLSDPLLAELARMPGIRAAPNEPYSPADEVYWTLDRHALSRNLPNVMIEIRNDEVRTEDAQLAWGERLADALARITLASQGESRH